MPRYHTLPRLPRRQCWALEGITYCTIQPYIRLGFTTTRPCSHFLGPPPTQAVLDPGAKSGARAWLNVKVQEGPELVVAALREGATEAQSLDLVFDQYSEFSVHGTAAVHITGACSPVASTRGG